jgi:hypothetical protein
VLIQVLHAFATEGAHCTKVRDILNASNVSLENVLELFILKFLGFFFSFLLPTIAEFLVVLIALVLHN